MRPPKLPYEEARKKFALKSNVSEEEKSMLQRLSPYDINTELVQKLEQQKKYCTFFKVENTKLKN